MTIPARHGAETGCFAVAVSRRSLVPLDEQEALPKDLDLWLILETPSQGDQSDADSSLGYDDA